jgi:hypothetical protein
MASTTETYEDTILSELKGTLTPQAAEGILLGPIILNQPFSIV